VDATVTPGKVDLKGQKVAALFTSLNNDYYAGWARGAEAAVKAFNGEYIGLTNEGDAATEISQFEQVIDQGAKIIFITAPDPANVPTMAKTATEKGVCLANTWEEPPWTSPFDYGDGYATYLTNSSVAAGYDVAKALFEKMGGKGNVVHLTGHPGSTPDTQRTEGFDKALKEYPNIKLVAREAGEWNRDDARKVMAGIISKTDGDIQGVFGQNDDVGVGAMNALKEAGITGVPITGIDGNAGTMDLIKAGDYYGAFTTFPFWNSGFSMVQAMDWCLGVRTSALNRQLWTGGQLITAETVDKYVSTFLGDSLPYDWQLMSKAAHPTDWDPQGGVSALNMEEMWSSVPQPAGYKLPQEYVDALPDMDAVNAEWADHWKLDYMK
jgi:ribose transport system substrate-binding protein